MIKIHDISKKYGYGSNCFLLNSEGEYAVIDPSVSVKDAEAILGREIPSVKYVFITHAHFGHMLEIDSWVERSATVVVGGKDGEALSDARLNCYLGFLGIDDGYYGEYTVANDKDVFTLGDKKITVIETPGHTRGGVSYMIDGLIFVGDTVFEGGGYGRCDLPGGDIMTLMKSISDIMLLPESMTVYPGHGKSTTVKEIKKFFE